MSLKAQAMCPVPEETARVARAAYPKGNLHMHMRDVLGSIYLKNTYKYMTCDMNDLALRFQSHFFPPLA